MTRQRKTENFYRRDPMAALNGMMGMTLEERGLYNTVLDLLYTTWRPVEDNRAFIAGWCGCAVQKLNPILDRLIARGKLMRVEDAGIAFITNARFEAERASVKGEAGARKPRAKAPDVEEKSDEVREKSGEVGEKSAGVGQNPSLLDIHIEENQPLTVLDKTREEKIRREPNGSNARDETFEKAWADFPDWGRRRSSRAKALAAWQRVADEAGGGELLLAAVQRYAADPDTQRDGGQYVPAFDRWLRDGRWEFFRPSLLTAIGEAVPDHVQRVWMEDWIAKGAAGWRCHERGPYPGQAGCRVRPSIVAEFAGERA